MRIIAIVRLLIRDDPSRTAQLRASKTALSLGTSPNSKEGKILLLQSLQNKTGMKYKIEKNIEQIFSRFLSEGKVTIRLKIPAHDIIISGDPVELKGFLKLLKSALENEEVKMPTVVARKTMHVLPPSNLRLAFAGRGQFTATTSLPLATKELSITNNALPRFDPRIGRLKFLQVLDLSGNLLSSLSEELSSLNVIELRLRGNHLGCTNNFRWMKPGSLRRSLKYLDLGKNQLEHIPCEVTRFFELITLKVDDNYLTNLPNSIGYLSKLRCFSASNNQLTVLPSSIVKLNLTTLNLCDNQFMIPELNFVDPSRLLKVPTLKNAASKIVIKASIPHYEGHTPLDVIYHLCSAFYCICRKAVFDSKCTYVLLYSLRNISSEFFYDSSSDHLIPTRFGVCSSACYTKLTNIAAAL
nr:PREDICTED: leucine-rich repeat protein 1-like [Bemisia tabaci]